LYKEWINGVDRPRDKAKQDFDILSDGMDLAFKDEIRKMNKRRSHYI
jgi:hypothetical protein